MINKVKKEVISTTIMSAGAYFIFCVIGFAFKIIGV